MLKVISLSIGPKTKNYWDLKLKIATAFYVPKINGWIVSLIRYQQLKTDSPLWYWPKNTDVAGRHGALRSTNIMDLTREKPIQTEKILDSGKNKSEIICTFVFNCNTHFWGGSNCILNLKQKNNNARLITSSDVQVFFLL